MGFSLTTVSLLHPAIDGLPHVKQLITSFLGPSPLLLISDACKFNSVELLDWIWESSCTSVDARTPHWSIHNYLRTDAYYHRYQFGRALQCAARDGDLELVKWLFTHFSRCIAPADVVEIAATNGHFDVLKYLLNHDVGRFGPHLKYQDDEHYDDERATFQWIPPRPTRGNAVTWSTDAILKAIQHKHFELPRWLFFSTPRTFDDEEVTTIIDAALQRNSTELAEVLVPEGRSLLEYARNTPSVQTIEWMLACGYLRPDEDIYPSLILFLTQKDRLDLMQRIWELLTASQEIVSVELWLGHWRAAMRDAAGRGNLPMLRWLADQAVGREVFGKKNYYPFSFIIREAAWPPRDFGVLSRSRHVGEILVAAADAKTAQTPTHWEAVVASL